MSEHFTGITHDADVSVVVTSHSLAPYGPVPRSWGESGVLAQLKEADVKTLLVLSMHANQHGQCFPSVPTIAKMSGLKERAVYAAITRLVDLKLIQRIARPQPQSNLYVLLQAKPAKVSPLHSDAPLHGGAGVHGGAVTPAPRCSRPLHHGAGKHTIEQNIKRPAAGRVAAAASKSPSESLSPAGERLALMGVSRPLLSSQSDLDRLVAIEAHVRKRHPNKSMEQSRLAAWLIRNPEESVPMTNTVATLADLSPEDRQKKLKEYQRDAVLKAIEEQQGGCAGKFYY